jgi:serine protease Do
LGSSGTGFFITQDEFLVTAAHLVNRATQIRLVTRTGLLTARLVKLDAANDLALLKAEGQFSSLPIISSLGVKLGKTLATVGFPNVELQGFSPKLAKGEIASLAGTEDDVRYFQISAPVQPGNSGGAFVDERGNVIGVVAAKLDAATALARSGALPENVNYAIKSSLLLSFLESIPQVFDRLKVVQTNDQQFEVVVDSAESATVMIIVY